MSMSRKTWAMLALAAIAALAMALPAYATVGDAGYLTYDSMAGTNAGTSPHGGYATTTQKCVVCHAVHNASTTGLVLLQGNLTDVSDACTYCHLDTLGAGYTQVYASDAANYSGADLPNAHNSAAGATCTGCHQVHGATSAMTANTYLTQKLLKKPAGDAYDTVYSVPTNADSNELALTKWCTACHGTSLATPYSYANPDGTLKTSHVMRAATDTYSMPDASTRRIAWKDSTYCSSCHASEYGTAAWPHFTAGNRFLVSGANSTDTTAAATDTEYDGICLRCHRDASSGVGVDF